MKALFFLVVILLGAQVVFGGDCGCQGDMCSCCEHIKVKHYIDGEICANISYHDLEIEALIILDGKVVYNYTCSAKNPPDVCFKVPYIEIVELCLHFYDMDLTDKELSGCLKVKAEVFKEKLAEVDLGCFHLDFVWPDELAA